MSGERAAFTYVLALVVILALSAVTESELALGWRLVWGFVIWLVGGFVGALLLTWRWAGHH